MFPPMTATASTSLTDKTIVITGASRGIGEAIATACSDAGARVVLASRKQADLDRVAGAIRERGGTALAIACHTGTEDDVKALFERAAAEFGPLDGLVNNAATNPYFGPTVDIGTSAIDKTFDVNVKGYFFCARELVRHLRARKATAGSIVNIASVAGTRAAPMQGVYGMSKAAVISMTQTLAFELGASNIRVNAIAPGLVETKFASAIVHNPMLHEHVVKRTPLARHGQPVEIAGAAVYLLSEASSFATGQVFVLDGGMTAT